jgi:ATP-dependent Clp protease protease subunit
MRLKSMLNNILIKHTGQTREVIERDTDRDIYFDAAKAVEYGLIDSVLEGAKAAAAHAGENGR